MSFVYHFTDGLIKKLAVFINAIRSGDLSSGLLFLSLGGIEMDYYSFCEFIKNLFMLKYLPEISNDTGLGILFVFGLLTSIHCLGMCGGIAISQTIRSSEEDVEASKYKWIMPSVLYNGGRVIGYTLVGGIIGGLGKVIGFNGALKGLVPLVGGIFIVGLLNDHNGHKPAWYFSLSEEVQYKDALFHSKKTYRKT